MIVRASFLLVQIVVIVQVACSSLLVLLASCHASQTVFQLRSRQHAERRTNSVICDARGAFFSSHSGKHRIKEPEEHHVAHYEEPALELRTKFGPPHADKEKGEETA